MLIYICDDSRADQLRLVHNIESYAKEKGAAVTVKLFSSADALLREYETSTEKPAVIFLDIYMDGTNGMEAAERLIELGMENGLVFTTSSEIHAVKAFSIGADGYLHKPFTHDDFVRAMKRFSRLFEESRRYITVMQGREEVNIYLNTLRFAESVGHSTVLHTSGGEVRVYLPLSSFFGQLEGEPDFLMCGRSYIANLSAVESFDAMMPGMSGVEALRKLRSDPASLCRETPVAVLTADAVVGARERYMSEGFDEYLSKPIISEELEQMLSRLVPGRIVTDSLPSAQKSGEPGSSLLNTAKGLEYSDNDPDFYRELLRLFTEEAPKSLERLSSALADNDLELYTTLVHGLKNNARGIGADSAGELCFEAEQTARAGNAAPLPELHLKIEQAITEAAAEAARLSEAEKITQ